MDKERAHNSNGFFETGVAVPVDTMVSPSLKLSPVLPPAQSAPVDVLSAPLRLQESTSQTGQNKGGKQAPSENAPDKASTLSTLSPAPRRRGRPRKGEEMSEEERKARRREVNRAAARRAHQKKLGYLASLEQVRGPLPLRSHREASRLPGRGS